MYMADLREEMMFYLEIQPAAKKIGQPVGRCKISRESEVNIFIGATYRNGAERRPSLSVGDQPNATAL
jgi:hypothetical protein